MDVIWNAIRLPFVAYWIESKGFCRCVYLFIYCFALIHFSEDISL